MNNDGGAKERKKHAAATCFFKYFYGVWSGLPELETFLYTSALAKSGGGGRGERGEREGVAEVP